MQYIRTSVEEAADAIAEQINQALKQGNVLLLLSGGSNIQLAVAIQKKIKTGDSQLTVSLVDERYGPVGHANSNWQQLLNAGFQTDTMQTIPVLSGKTPEQTADTFGTALTNAFEKNDSILAVLGLGTDGHTSGILPGSPAVEAPEPVVYFQGPDYPRITTTPAALRNLNQAFLVAFGDNKHVQLETLLHQAVPISEQPAQLLKELPQVTIYSDQEISV